MKISTSSKAVKIIHVRTAPVKEVLSFRQFIYFFFIYFYYYYFYLFIFLWGGIKSEI